MVININGRLYASYFSPKKLKYSKLRLKLAGSLLVLAVGIFLLPKNGYLSTITADKLIELTNIERTDSGLPALTANQLLTQAAIQKAKEIFASQTFKHNIGDKKFSSWVMDSGYNYSYVGENLAIDFSTSEGVMSAWNDSPTHKKNILSPYYQEIGIATLDGNFQNQSTTLVVQIFGAPPQAIFQTPANNSLISLNNRLDLGRIAGQWQEPQSVNLANSENLLTHSIIAQSPIPLNSSKFIIERPSLNYNQVNKLFEQLKTQTFFYLGLQVYLYLFLILLIFFQYYTYFSKIKRLSKFKITT